MFWVFIFFSQSSLVCGCIVSLKLSSYRTRQNAQDVLFWPFFKCFLSLDVASYVRRFAACSTWTLQRWRSAPTAGCLPHQPPRRRRRFTFEAGVGTISTSPTISMSPLTFLIITIFQMHTKSAYKKRQEHDQNKC